MRRAEPSYSAWLAIGQTLQRNAMPLPFLVARVLEDLDAAEQTINPTRAADRRLELLVHLDTEQYAAANYLATILQQLQMRLGYLILQSESCSPSSLVRLVQPSYSVWRRVPMAIWVAVPYRWMECLTLGVEARLTGMARRAAEYRDTARRTP